MTHYRLTEEARAARKELPMEVQCELFDVLDHVCDHPDEGRPLYGPVKLYKHDDPPFEVTYSHDEDKDTIDFLHFSVPFIRLTRDVFLSYAHEDADWLQEIHSRLTPLEDLGVKLWADTYIEAGDTWNRVLTENLESASAAILLVSDSFLGSEFIREVELPRILAEARKEKSGKRGVKLLWVLVRKCDYESHPLGSEIGSYQAVVDPRLPLDEFDSDSKRHEVLNRIQKKIAKAIAN